MRMYLARKKNGLYMLTKFEPVLTNIFHTDHLEVFVRPGDPINFQGLCPFSIHALFGTELEPGEFARVEVKAEVLRVVSRNGAAATNHRHQAVDDHYSSAPK
jgi:hypothetical protein